MTKVEIIVPVHNEEKNISLLVQEIEHCFTAEEQEYKICFVDDGSTDQSLEVLKRLTSENKKLSYISFSRNFGKDAALKAGIDKSDADVVITMDADLQHPPELIKQMLQLWKEGNQVVYAYREEANQQAGFIHRMSSAIFYKLMNKLSDLKLEQGIADYRLIDKSVVDIIRPMQENDIFLRGLVKWVGFQQIGIPYTPDERLEGKSAYSKKKLINLALQGITSFSTRPLYAAAYLGFTFSALSLLYIPYVFISFLMGHPHRGWASLIVTVVFFGGLQLTILGVMGLYLGKLFMQSKQRPLYIIKEEA
ncbi:MAG: glycosyltransferase family 2 protein [Bacteroidetes bacterium]|nr:glycosyltransferase family 2 protein [Bacteroidota bacterium]